ncbi:hypothetical protein LCGC14_2104090 [marine sediment metagenome]|uniref:DUF6874 domain-containing protein n=1 Tax=marine sediment metagenome TaxID=412755 RepID=A0A0F9H5G7_9ZZZZ
MINWKKGTRAEVELASDIAKRAVKLLGTGKVLTFAMDIQACHTHGCCLKLVDLLKASEGDFLHDVLGINSHIDRSTGKLKDCFLPRYAVCQ